MDDSDDPEGELPFEHYLGVLCDAFHCLPDAAYRSWLALPVGMMEAILEYRVYAQAHTLYEAADTPEARKRLKRTGTMALVEKTTFDLVREARAAKHKG